MHAPVYMYIHIEILVMPLGISVNAIISKDSQRAADFGKAATLDTGFGAS